MADREHVPSVVALSIALNWYAWRLQRASLARGEVVRRVTIACHKEVAASADHWAGTYGTWGYEP